MLGNGVEIHPPKIDIRPRSYSQGQRAFKNTSSDNTPHAFCQGLPGSGNPVAQALQGRTHARTLRAADEADAARKPDDGWQSIAAAARAAGPDTRAAWLRADAVRSRRFGRSRNGAAPHVSPDEQGLHHAQRWFAGQPRGDTHSHTAWLSPANRAPHMFTPWILVAKQ